MLVVRRLSIVLVAVLVVGAIAATPFLWRDYGWYVAFQPGLKTLDGTPIDRPTSTFPDSAKVGLVVFFMADCSACAEELQALGEMERLGGLVGAVAVNVHGSLLDVQKFIRDNGVKVAGNNPVLLGSDGAVIANEDGSFQVPYTFLLVRDGEVWRAVDGVAGALSAAQLETLAYYALLAQGEMPLDALRRLLAEGKVSSLLLEMLKTDFFSMPVLSALLETGNITFEEIGTLMEAGKIAYFDGALQPVLWSSNGNHQGWLVRVNRNLSMDTRETWHMFHELYQMALLNDEFPGAIFVVFVLIEKETPPLMTICAYTDRERMGQPVDISALSDDEIWAAMDERWPVAGYDIFVSLAGTWPLAYDAESLWAFAFVAASHHGEPWAHELRPSLSSFYKAAREYYAQQEGERE